MPARSDPNVTRFLLWGSAIALVGALSVIAWAALVAPDFPILNDREAWIGPDDRVVTGAVASLSDRPRVVSYVRDIHVVDSPGAIGLDVQALGRFEVRVNGKTVASGNLGPESNWKRATRIEALPWKEGTNRVEVDVSNARGPPLLKLSSLGVTPPWRSDGTWIVEEPGKLPHAAQPADDQRPTGDARVAQETWNFLAKHRDALLGFAVLGALFSLISSRFSFSPANAPLWAGFWIGSFWLFLFFAKTQHLALHAGFDGPDHLEYIRLVGDQGSLPLATDGPAMYHPPLFYVVAAGLRAIAGEQPGTLVRLLPFLSGLFQVAVAFLLARRLFPEDRRVAALAIGVAGLLPVNLYMSSYLSNEPLHAALSALALYWTVDLLLVAGWPGRRLLCLGVTLGLVLLTKVTGLLLLPLIGLFLVAKTCFVDAPGTTRGAVLGRVAAIVGPVVLLAGGFYLRNWVLLGRPFVGNWDVPGSAFEWWQYPGFHTWSYFTDFGQSLRQPFFAGYHSLADGLYATLWTDSLLGGVSSFAYRHPYWNYEWMAMLPWLAFPATCALVIGWAGFGWRSLREAATPQRLAFAFLASVIATYFFAVFFINLRLPFYAQAKTSYALAITAPLALAGAWGLLWIHRRLDQPGLRWARVLFHAWAAAFVAALVCAFGN